MGPPDKNCLLSISLEHSVSDRRKLAACEVMTSFKLSVFLSAKKFCMISWCKSYPISAWLVTNFYPLGVTKPQRTVKLEIRTSGI